MIDPTDSVTRSIPHPVRLDFTSATRTYSIALDRDLFDQWTVTRSWARKENNLRGKRITHVDSFEAGMALVQAIARMREKRGYQPA
ncbi:WGR domain-containing protein [Noviherbaspirillum autotrophicum]|uniref:WGR domain-containing protein n=1 Tax=Noviherbaspirillum autotrophicum TaxID=709839 RepID=UPI00069348B2|nr:WGR domain-containing protein [Noviherbaspirillum autotrophicum]